MSLIDPAVRRLEEGGAATLARAPEGYDAFVVAELTRALAKDGERRAVTLVFVARDGLRAQSFIDALGFAAPEIEALHFPSWDCQPYDRVSPNAAISAEKADEATKASGGARCVSALTEATRMRGRSTAPLLRARRASAVMRSAEIAALGETRS